MRVRLVVEKTKVAETFFLIQSNKIIFGSGSDRCLFNLLKYEEEEETIDLQDAVIMAMSIKVVFSFRVEIEFCSDCYP